MLAQISAPSLRSVSLEVGDVLTIVDVRVDGITLGGENPRVLENDSLVVKTTRLDQPLMVIPVREYLKMAPVDGGEHYSRPNENTPMADLPNGFVVKAVKNRTLRGEPAYPTAAYKGSQDFFDQKIDYPTLIASGLKEVDAAGNPGGLPQLKDYTINVQ